MRRSDSAPPREPRGVDAIVVLGARVLPDGRPGVLLRARMDHACALYRKGAARHFVVSGKGEGRRPSEAAVMARMALRQGVPDDALCAEGRSRDTLENAVRCTELFRRRGWRTGILVTNGFHAVRALWSFRAAGLDGIRLSTAPSPVSAGTRWFLLAREAPALAWYAWRLADRKRRQRR